MKTMKTWLLLSLFVLVVSGCSIGESNEGKGSEEVNGKDGTSSEKGQKKKKKKIFKKWNGYYLLSSGQKESLLIIQGTGEKTVKFELQTNYYGQTMGNQYFEGKAKVKGKAATYTTETSGCTVTFAKKKSSMLVTTSGCEVSRPNGQKERAFDGTYTYSKEDPRWTGTYSFGDLVRGSELTFSDVTKDAVKVSIHSWEKTGRPQDYDTKLEKEAIVQSIKGPAVKVEYIDPGEGCSFYVAIEGKQAFVGGGNCIDKNGARLLENYPYIKVR